MATTERYDPETGEPIEEPALAAWQKLLLVLSIVLGGVGVAYGGISGSPADVDSASGDGPASGTGTEMQPSMTPDGFISIGPDGEPVPAGTGGTGPGTVEEAPFWPPLLAKGGLSFFLAFCVGYALRAAMKVTMILVGLIVLATLGLQQVGVIESIDWTRAEEFWDSLTANLGEHFQSLGKFVSGSLPTAASGGVGLFARPVAQRRKPA
ncbi:MAG: FUN14 domain-containing protein, partial [Planctomycetota bacterium]